ARRFFGFSSTAFFRCAVASGSLPRLLSISPSRASIWLLSGASERAFSTFSKAVSNSCWRTASKPKLAQPAGSPGAISVARVSFSFARTSSPGCNPARPPENARTRSGYSFESGLGNPALGSQAVKVRRRESTEKTEITEQTEIFWLVPDLLPFVPLFPSFPYSLFTTLKGLIPAGTSLPSSRGQRPARRRRG